MHPIFILILMLFFLPLMPKRVIANHQSFYFQILFDRYWRLCLLMLLISRVDNSPCIPSSYHYFWYSQSSQLSHSYCLHIIPRPVVSCIIAITWQMAQFWIVCAQCIVCSGVWPGYTGWFVLLLSSWHWQPRMGSSCDCHLWSPIPDKWSERETQ